MSDTLTVHKGQHLHKDRLLIVGNPDPIHVGAHFVNAANALNVPVTIFDVSRAYSAPWLIAKINWRLRGRRPSQLESFSLRLVELCKELKPKWLLTTGICPISDWAIKAIGDLKIQRLNFLTDDPWNKAHYAKWFMKGLTAYDHVFSPRKANLLDLERAGCRKVSYLPFGYAPELHFAEPPLSQAEKDKFTADTVFAGGADHDRIHYMTALSSVGMNVALYGGYWTRYAGVKNCFRGYADPQTLRKAVGGAHIALCLVRRANRDGHSMRTFEVPAIGACMLVEETDEHKDIFGPEGEAVVYFNSLEQLIEKAQWLKLRQDERQRLAKAANTLITTGKHSYQDRLSTILSIAAG